MLKQITNIKAAFCPFSKTATSTKVFLNRVYSKENLQANPTCKIDVTTTSHLKDPSRIDVKFKDGKTLSVNADDLHGDDIIFQVEKYSRKLSQQEDLKNQ
ncbi:hypothetical protein LPJ78_000768 [Coemansia sp. RSA 989]|nr:hypothetical protein LPJ79_000439 [Coemansia sp. RSA 1821]KAJ1867716.1 hypothetical protein LPJ78_000768 [Coemansia sp. RSA 989]KAJ2650706.1 hypothetical protein IWW40_002214 [Coemansia sp. RSA 1250]KAJ2673877.1 hypothetical protein IWW42_002007 [Coemansia sp. RSA 1085]